MTPADRQIDLPPGPRGEILARLAELARTVPGQRFGRTVDFVGFMAECETGRGGRGLGGRPVPRVAAPVSGGPGTVRGVAVETRLRERHRGSSSRRDRPPQRAGRRPPRRRRLRTAARREGPNHDSPGRECWSCAGPMRVGCRSRFAVSPTRQRGGATCTGSRRSPPFRATAATLPRLRVGLTPALVRFAPNRIHATLKNASRVPPTRRVSEGRSRTRPACQLHERRAARRADPGHPPGESPQKI